MTFAANIAAYAARTKLSIDVTLRRAVLNIGNGVINDTPVDTGRLRNNWFYAEGAAPADTIEAIDKDGNGSRARLSAVALELKAGGILYMANALPYARRIEYEGWSKKAPVGMVRINAGRWADAVNKALAS